MTESCTIESAFLYVCGCRALADFYLEHFTERHRIMVNRARVGCDAFVLYEYILSFKDEVECIWKRQVSAVSIFYFTNRYGLLLYRILTAVGLVSFGSSGEDEADMVCPLIHLHSRRFVHSPRYVPYTDVRVIQVSLLDNLKLIMFSCNIIMRVSQCATVTLDMCILG